MDKISVGMKSERSFSCRDENKIRTGSESRTVRLILGTIL